MEDKKQWKNELHRAYKLYYAAIMQSFAGNATSSHTQSCNVGFRCVEAGP